jgi:hypothetical protein
VSRALSQTAAAGSDEGKVQVYVSFDVANDADLYEQLVEQSQNPGSSFSVQAGSRKSDVDRQDDAAARRRITAADQVIVICGEQTIDSVAVFCELRTAQEQSKPYFLLWGRRDSMCTKPGGAKPSDGMYSWTPDIIEEQIAQIRRAAEREARASELKRTRMAPSGARRAESPSNE